MPGTHTPSMFKCSLIGEVWRPSLDVYRDIYVILFYSSISFLVLSNTRRTNRLFAFVNCGSNLGGCGKSVSYRQEISSKDYQHPTRRSPKTVGVW